MPVPIRRIYQSIRILPTTKLVINRLALRLGYRANKGGRLLDVFADILEDVPFVPPARKQGRTVSCRADLTQEEIKSIRKSKDKQAAIAAEHRITKTLVWQIRARKIYKWVK